MTFKQSHSTQHDSFILHISDGLNLSMWLTSKYVDFFQPNRCYVCLIRNPLAIYKNNQLLDYNYFLIISKN